MLSLLRRAPASELATDLIVRERPPLVSDIVPLAPAPRDAGLDEYDSLTKSLGIKNPHIGADLGIERFKAFLRKKDWAIFSLPTVIAYMDEKAKAESKAKSGWHWRPLRAKDDIENAVFGKAAYQNSQMRGPSPASDYYLGPHMGISSSSLWALQNGMIVNGGSNTPVKQPSSALPYDKLVPIHALRKVAAIEAEFVGKAPGNPPIAFFVCDYAPAPHIDYPDPFLMAVVNNAQLAQGVGRFVIDFWDEPGFGLDKQLA